MQRAILASISPLDHRYALSFPELFDRLSNYLSEEATIRYQAAVEAALVETLAERGLCSRRVADEVSEACRAIASEEVYAEEERTRHNIRALVNVIQRRVSDGAKPFVHFTATSTDIVDTARSLQLRDVTLDVLVPQLKTLVSILIAIVRREADALQVGRTHGQHAVPITFGFAMAEYVSRLGGRTLKLEAAAKDLRGKMSGAVGAYNASSLFFDDPISFESEVLARLGLRPGSHSTQVVEPEFAVDYAHAIASTFGVIANLADDVRHLQRTEIGEVGEAFDEEQVGSSTMPHKRNPWNFEHVKSLWKTFLPRLQTAYFDQISEHQRDLTNSASGRFLAESVAGFSFALERLKRVLRRLVVDQGRMEANLRLSERSVVAEPMYILLAAHGHPDAHEAVRRLTLEQERSAEEFSLWELAKRRPELAPYLERFSPKQVQMLQNPRLYVGIAAKKALDTADAWEAKLANSGDEGSASR